MASKIKKALKKIGKAALVAGAGYAAMKGLKNRKAKSDLAGTEDGKDGSTKITGGTNLNDYDGSTKKDTSVKTKTTIQDNKSKDTGSKPIPGIKVKAKDGKVNYIKASKFDKTSANKEFKGPDSKYDYKNRAAEKNTAGIAKPQKNLMATVFPKSSAADEFKASTQDYNRSNQTYKSGGRVKGCGKALRGFGKAMKKGNR